MDWSDRTNGKTEKIPVNLDLSMIENVKSISDWLKTYNQKYDIRYVVMYHAAGIEAPILDEGLLAGNGRRKNYGMSESGYVYLATTPKMAEMFGSMAYNDSFMIYEVIVPVGKLLPDKNRLLYTAPEDAKGNKLAQSLVYAGSARVKGDIERWQIKLYQTEKELEKMSKYDISARVNPLKDQSGHVKAMASVTIDNVVAINDLTVVEGKNGNLFVGFPQSKDGAGNFRDIVQFLKDEQGKMTKDSLEVKESITKILVDMYKNNERATPEKSEQDKQPVMHEVKAYVTPLRESENALRGLATVQVGDMFKIGSVRVNENTKEDSENFGKNFVAMPSRPDKSSETGYRDVVHPVNKEFGEKLRDTVLKQYGNQLAWKENAAKKEQTAQHDKQAPKKTAPDIE